MYAFGSVHYVKHFKSAEPGNYSDTSGIMLKYYIFTCISVID